MTTVSQNPPDQAKASTLPSRARILRYDQYFDQRTFSDVLRKTNKKTKKNDHGKKPVFIVRRIINYKGQHERTEIDIKSSAVANVLIDIHKGVDGLNLLLSAPKCDPHLLFFSYSGIQARLEAEKLKESPDPELIDDSAVALEYIKEELAETFADVESLVSSQSITFTLLWTIFAPNTPVYNYHQHTEQHRILRSLRFRISRRPDDSLYAIITCQAIVHDGNSFGTALEDIEIDEFNGARSMRDLPLYPLRCHDRWESIRDEAIQRGRKFAHLQKHTYGEISGPGMKEIMNSKDEPQRIKFNTYGRLMIDPAAFRTFQPNSTYNYEVYKRLHIEDLNDEHYMVCTPIVLGFCFGVKEWGGFALDRVNDISWSEDAFNSLVLAGKQKTLVLALVKQHDIRSSKFDDIVQGKGKGLVGLLAGPPGCGKTLTAEAVAEATKRPLYCISAGELGTEAMAVDKALTQILDIAQRWKAVLLLDEADVFLFQRDDRDVLRNALVSIFLRQLEYYQGILFLTTNMIAQCDSAFESRFHFTLFYPHLDSKSRRQIWKTFINKSSIAEAISDTEIETLADENLNGRQIKNIISTAHSLALDEDKPLSVDHIQTVLEVTRDWNKAREHSHI